MQLNKLQAFIFWAAILMVLLLSLMPLSVPQLSVFHWQDKVLHFVSYGVLCFLAIKVYGDRLALWKIAIALAFFGLGIEIAQSFTEYRLGEVNDLLANILGILAVIFFQVLLRKIYE
ncbi:VanZ family protein [Gammaproteobacteria bacterium]|nr:VanZ family protein [Gammaproteobacteria bacterium]